MSHVEGTSYSKQNDSDSNTSDDSLIKANRNFENNEKTSNKGMSLMVMTYCLSIF